MKLKFKIFISAICIFAAVILLNVVCTLVYRPIGPAVTIDAYLKGGTIEKRLERHYRDDFTLVDVKTNSDDIFSGYELFGYNYKFKSEKCGDKIIYVETDYDLNSNSIYDNYLEVRYRDKAEKLIKKSLDEYFGKGKYYWNTLEWSISKDSDRDYFNTMDVDNPDIYYYIGQRFFRLEIIVSPDFNAKGEQKIGDEILKNLTSTFDTKTAGFNILILFDREDNMIIPSQDVRDSDAFNDYYNLNYWEKRLDIDSEHISGNNYAPPQYTWKTNEKENYEHKTKNEFLNGAKPKAVINGFEFAIDGSVTLDKLLKQTGYVHYNNVVEAKNYDPGDVTEAELGVKSFFPTVKVGVVNKTGGNTEVKNGSVYSVSVGNTFTVDAVTYRDCSVCGLKVGDELTEEKLVKMFGPFEEKEILDSGDIAYGFVDGTVSGYALANSYSKRLRVILQNGAVRFLYCSYYETDNDYKYYSFSK